MQLYLVKLSEVFIRLETVPPAWQRHKKGDSKYFLRIAISALVPPGVSDVTPATDLKTIENKLKLRYYKVKCFRLLDDLALQIKALMTLNVYELQ